MAAGNYDDARRFAESARVDAELAPGEGRGGDFPSRWSSMLQDRRDWAACRSRIDGTTITKRCMLDAADSENGEN